MAIETEAKNEVPGREDLEALWKAANDHCVTVYGQWVPDEYEGDDYPPAPESDAEIVRQVTQYFKSTG